MSRAVDKLQEYGQDLAGSVSPARSQVAAMRAIARNAGRTPRRLAHVAALTAGFFAIVNVAAAGLADPSAPGDALYGLDRAYERVAEAIGLGDDNADERLDEALTLINRSDLAGAVDLVTEAAPSADLTAASDAISQGAAHPELRSAVLELVNAARRISAAARSGDEMARLDAQESVRARAAAVAQAARSQEGEGTPATPPGPADTPAVTAPGQQGNQEQGNQEQGNQSNQGQGNQGQGNQGQGNRGQSDPGSPADTAPGSGSAPNPNRPDK